MTSAEVNMEVGYLTNELRAALAEVRSLRGVIQAVQGLLWLVENDPLQLHETFNADAAMAAATELRAALAAAADEPQPAPARPPTSTHTRPTPQADRRLAELTRLGVLHPDKDDQPAAADRVRADVLKLHQRCDNGHCSCGALRWPCSTARVVAADAPQPEDDLPTCAHGHTVSHYIDSKTAQYHQLDNICSGPSPTVLLEPEPARCTHGQLGPHTYCPHNNREGTCRQWGSCMGPRR